MHCDQCSPSRLLSHHGVHRNPVLWWWVQSNSDIYILSVQISQQNIVIFIERFPAILDILRPTGCDIMIDIKRVSRLDIQSNLQRFECTLIPSTFNHQFRGQHINQFDVVCLFQVRYYAHRNVYSHRRKCKAECVQRQTPEKQVECSITPTRFTISHSSTTISGYWKVETCSNFTGSFTRITAHEEWTQLFVRCGSQLVPWGFSHPFNAGGLLLTALANEPEHQSEGFKLEINGAHLDDSNQTAIFKVPHYHFSDIKRTNGHHIIFWNVIGRGTKNRWERRNGNWIGKGYNSGRRSHSSTALDVDASVERNRYTNRNGTARWRCDSQIGQWPKKHITRQSVAWCRESGRSFMVFSESGTAWDDQWATKYHNFDPLIEFINHLLQAPKTMKYNMELQVFDGDSGDEIWLNVKGVVFHKRDCPFIRCSTPLSSNRNAHFSFYICYCS